MQTYNPFETILNELAEVKTLLHTIQKEPKIEFKKKLYTIKEASEILKLDYQTIRNHIIKGNVIAEKVGRQYRIRHLDLMAILENVKSLKYKR